MTGYLYSLPLAFPDSAYVPLATTFGGLEWDGYHATESLDLLLEQFKDMPLTEGYVLSFVRRVQELEDAIWAILLASDIDNAVDAQLDGLGDLVGEGRRERTDAQYRAAIRVRILINRCNGTHPEILRILELYTDVAADSGLVALKTPAPAALSLWVYLVPESTEDLRVIARSIKPAGVNLDARVDTSATRPARFGWSGGAITGQTADNYFGWSGDATVGGLFATGI